MSFKRLFDFEQALAEYTGAPYVVVTDSCTHAMELCFRLDQVTYTEFTAYTYLSVPQMIRQLGIRYELKDQPWQGEYQFGYTNIWDSARRLERGMYRPGHKQCLSFGNGKPLQLGRAGAILLDNEHDYQTLGRMRSDGRDLSILPWTEQKVFAQGYHYCPTLEVCELGSEKLPLVDEKPKYIQYSDLRTIDFAV
jgi:dTDP-4-amino-4,6-dideoxygalactose transaminase